ncbi:M48 family metallopeptidase [Streptomyces sp. NPDC050504]|uniref:M48 family metallopeptidase n=1 Tax=Streptomyces sp. NPDC050504 TaxID=3365618 RepID=UPI0037B65893
MPSSDPLMPAALPARHLSDGDLLTVGEVVLRVRVTTRRTRLGLTVERDGAVTLRAPVECGEARARQFVEAHAGWIAEKARLRDRFRPAHPSRELLNGTEFRYLGRAYRLLLVDGQNAGDGVRLRAGRLQLARADATDPVVGRTALVGWYRRVGADWARGRLQPWAGRLGVAEPVVKVRDLGQRWGTFLPGRAGQEGEMALHWAVFQLPIRLVDYVIAHELAHIRVSGHGPDYWRLLRRAIPECEQLKAELDEMGRRVWLGGGP